MARRLMALSLALFFSSGAPMAATFTIDDFSMAQLLNASAGRPSRSEASGSGIFGGARDMLVQSDGIDARCADRGRLPRALGPNSLHMARRSSVGKRLSLQIPLPVHSCRSGIVHEVR